MTPRRPLAPLVQDSPEARLLFDIWSGTRVIDRRRSDLGEQWLDTLATTASHLCSRGQFTITAFALSDSGYAGPLITDHLLLSLKKVLHISDFGAVTGSYDARFGLRGTRISYQTFGLAIGEPEGDMFDLVVALERESMDWLQERACLRMGRQTLCIGISEHSGSLARSSYGEEHGLVDRTDLDMPLDVAIAGGVGR